jgi:Ca2+-binding RTX toxin-like protein
MANPIKVFENAALPSTAGAPNPELNPHLHALANGTFLLAYTEDTTADLTWVIRLNASGGYTDPDFDNLAPAGDSTQGSLASIGTQLAGVVRADTAAAGASILLTLETFETPHTLVEVAPEANDNRSPEIVALTDGRYAIAWVDATTSQILYRIYDPALRDFTGAAQAASVDPVYTSGSLFPFDQISLTATANGNFVVGWIDSSSHNQMRVIDPDGAPSPVIDVWGGDGGVIDIVELGDGRLMAISRDNNGEDTYVRIFEANGTNPTTAVPTGLVSTDWTVATALHDGRVMVVCASPFVTGDIYGRILNADGTPDSDVFVVAGDGTSDLMLRPHIATLADGRVAVTYENSTTTNVELVIYDPREAGIDLAGTTGNDDYVGSRFADRILTGNGNDVVHGGDGADYINGGNGNDDLAGGAGADTLIGGFGNDVLRSETGDADTLIGGWGNDDYYPADQADTIVENAGQGHDKLWSAADYILAAGVEIEVLNVFDRFGTTAVNLTGNALTQTILGNDGVNRLDSGGGSDVLNGYLGNDAYMIRSGAETIQEGPGGGTADWLAAAVSYTLNAFAEVEQMWTISSTATTPINLTGNGLQTSLNGNYGVNRLDSGGGNATMAGGLGNDVYFIRSGSETVVEGAGQGASDWVATQATYTLASNAQVESFTTMSSGGTTVIHLTGNQFGQTIEGNNAGQTLTGNGGADTLIGYMGRDTLWGGSANDTFRWMAINQSGSAVATADRVMDFKDTGGEQDKLDVGGIDANTATGPDDAFVLDLDASFSTGEIRQSLVNGGADLLLEFNNDADASSDMAILVVGRTTLLDAADFTL